MQSDFSRYPHKSAESREAHSDIPTFVPSMDTRMIFRQLIVDELRAGRLTQGRRKRLVRYAAQLRLTAVQAGRLIESCRAEALASVDRVERSCALRLAEPSAERLPAIGKFTVVVALAVILEVIVIAWVW